MCGIMMGTKQVRWLPAYRRFFCQAVSAKPRWAGFGVDNREQQHFSISELG